MIARTDPTETWKAARVVGRCRPVRSSSAGFSDEEARAMSSASNSSRDRVVMRRVVGLVLGPVQRQPQTQDGPSRLTDATEGVLDPAGAGKLLLVPVTEQPVAYVRDGCPPVARRGPVHQEVQRLEIPAQGYGRVVLGRPPVPGERHGSMRQMQSEGVRTLGAPCVEQQHAEPFRGDLGVRDASLQQRGLVRVRCALLQAALDHQGGFVQPRGAPPHLVKHLLQLLGSGVEQFDLQRDELGDSRPEGIAQSCQDAPGCLRDHGEPDHRTAAESDEQSHAERRRGQTSRRRRTGRGSRSENR